MAMRRRYSASKSGTYEDFQSSGPSTSSIAARAIRASNAYRNSSSFSFAYGDTNSVYEDHYNSQKDLDNGNDSSTYSKDDKEGFWGILARKAKSIIDDDNTDSHKSEDYQTKTQPQSRWAIERVENSGLSAAHSSMGSIGGTIKKAFEENLNIMESRLTDEIRETTRSQNRRMTLNQYTDPSPLNNPFSFQSDYESQLKASRDVANAMAAKAKLRLRELKSVKADLAFAKERCTQLEEENKKLRESRQKGVNAADDDLIRCQLESLLAEKARLAQENSQYAQENRLLREIVEYHQLTMQNLVYLDQQGIEEAIEEVDEEVEEVLSLHGSTYPSPACSTATDALSPIPPYRPSGSRLSTSSSGILMPQSPPSPRPLTLSRKNSCNALADV